MLNLSGVNLRKMYRAGEVTISRDEAKKISDHATKDDNNGDFVIKIGSYYELRMKQKAHRGVVTINRV